MKIPPHQFDETVAFYRDILQLHQLRVEPDCVGFDFDGKSLWLDRTPTASHVELWLEIHADDLEAAKAYFEKQGVTRCDEIEKLPPDFEGFWIANPAGAIHLVSNKES